MRGQGVRKDPVKAKQLLELAMHSTEVEPDARRRAKILLRELEQTCTACGAPSTLCCSACKAVRYCSRQCQKSVFKAHGRPCKAAASQCPTGSLQSPPIASAAASSDDVEAGIRASLQAQADQAAEQNAAIVEALLRSRNPYQNEQGKSSSGSPYSIQQSYAQPLRVQTCKTSAWH